MTSGHQVYDKLEKKNDRRQENPYTGLCVINSDQPIHINEAFDMSDNKDDPDHVYVNVH